MVVNSPPMALRSSSILRPSSSGESRPRLTGTLTSPRIAVWKGIRRVAVPHVRESGHRFLCRQRRGAPAPPCGLESVSSPPRDEHLLPCIELDTIGPMHMEVTVERPLPP